MAGKTAKDFDLFSQAEQILIRPDNIIGVSQKTVENYWFFDLVNLKMTYGSMEFTPGCIHLFNEILANALDNADDSRLNGVNPGFIQIEMDNKTVSVLNYGLPIPVEVHPQHKIWIPDMIFGHLNSSSHYKDDGGKTIGTNGWGAKAVNLMSYNFTIVIHDSIRHKRYQQSWHTNMKVRDEPVISDYPGDISSTQVIYDVDFPRFGLSDPVDGVGGYSSLVISHLAQIAANASFTAKVPVIFNGVTLNYPDIVSYAKLYIENITPENSFTYIQPGSNPNENPVVEVLIIDTEVEKFDVSFANHSYTSNGGIHLDAVVKSFGESAIQVFNSVYSESKKNEDKNKRPLLKPSDVEKNVTIFVNVRVNVPPFRLHPQIKTKLAGPTKYAIPIKDVKCVKDWKLMEKLEAILKGKQNAVLSKSDGKLRNVVNVQYLSDAGNAGGRNRDQCVLCLTEGKSGAGYANKYLDSYPGGRDFIGILPMRGKGLNVRKYHDDLERINNNSEITSLKKSLGLVEGTDYLQDANFARLRYGSVLIMADADVDGIHIVGLILNYFDVFYRSLIKRGYIMFYRTPIIRAHHRNVTLSFYSDQEYGKWLEETRDSSKYQIKYFKGLASSSDKNIKDDYANQRQIVYIYDDRADESMRLAFDNKMSNHRKTWLMNFTGSQEIVTMGHQPITNFIHNELINFSLADIQRSIPKMVDGLKESLRKVVYGCFLEWKNSIGTERCSVVKVKQLSAFISRSVNYHHNEDILSDVVAKMTQYYTGSGNNIPWFVPDGQFGTRFAGGTDGGASRYIFVKPKPIMSKLIRSEDFPILDHIIDEGNKCEPEIYYPVIPIILVNGANGIGTGFSTYIPSFSPFDLINWIRNKICDKPQIKFNPEYLGFTGKIIVGDRTNQPNGVMKVIDGTSSEIVSYQTTDLDEVPDDLSSEGPVEEKPKSPQSMYIYGNYTIDGDGKIIVTELPIGRRPDHYDKWLSTLLVKKEIISYKNLCGSESIRFEIVGMNLTGATGHKRYAQLKLVMSYGMSNMVALNNQGIPVRYRDQYHILEEFYHIRLAAYERRRNFILNNLIEQVNALNGKIKFILDIVEDRIIINKRSKNDIKADMVKLGHPTELLDSVKIVNCTEDEINRLTQKATDVKAKYDHLENTSAQEIWLTELTELEQEYLKTYEEHYQRINEDSVNKRANSKPRRKNK